MNSGGAQNEGASQHFSFLFTDIENSSVKWLRYGDAMRDALAQHDAILRGAIGDNCGEVFKTAGDAFFGAFKSPENALDAALCAQRQLSKTDWSSVDGCTVRMAIHCGPAGARDGDYFGQALNRCARLLNLGFGGQILASRSIVEELTRRDTDVDFPQIGVNPLDDPDVEEPIHQVAVADLRQDFPPLRDPRALPNNLPQALASMVGREREIAEILNRLAERRWVTLTGIGGIGKTRLSIEIAAILANASLGGEIAKRVRGRVPGGVWSIELAPLTTADLIASTVANAMAIELPGARPPLRELVDRLRSKAALLLLDNCEHLLDGVAQFGFVVLTECPQVLVLATSQDLVGLPAEVAVPVGELGLPAATVATAQEALQSPAVELFVARARSADPSFHLTDRDVPAAVQICRDLDGIALAIEMAAARAPMLGVGALAKRLEDRFRELARADGQGPSRHRTLRAAIDWSYGLLGRREQALLRRVSVFAAGYSMNDAIAVTADERIEEVDVMNALSELVRRSLVVRDQRHGEPRFRLLQTVLSYAHDRLLETDEGPALEHRHLLRMAARMEECFAAASDLPDALLREDYESDLPNVRAALTRGFADHQREAVRMAGATQPLLAAMGLLPEARGWLETAVEHAGTADPAATARVLLSFGLTLGFSDPARACAVLERAESHYSTTPGPQLAQLLVMKGRLAQVVAGRETESRRLLAEARPMIERGGWKRLKGHLYRGLGNEEMTDGRIDQAVGMMRRSETAFVDAGAEGAASTVRTSLGYLLWAGGRLEEAIEQCRAVLDDLRNQAFIDDTVLGFVLGNLAGMLTERGALEEAAPLVVEAAPLLFDPWQIWVIFDHVALFHAKSGALDTAARAIGFTDRAYDEHVTARQPNEARARQSTVEIIDRAQPAERRAALEAEGRSWTSEQAINVAKSANSVVNGSCG